jgi:hypothetical protein
MAIDEESVLNRIDEFEWRVGAIEHDLLSPDALDNEIRSLDHRLDEVRKETGG